MPNITDEAIRRYAEFDFPDSDEQDNSVGTEAVDQEDSDSVLQEEIEESDELEEHTLNEYDDDEVEIQVPARKIWENPYIKLGGGILGGVVILGGLGHVLSVAVGGNSGQVEQTPTPFAQNSPQSTQESREQRLEQENGVMKGTLATNNLNKTAKQINEEIQAKKNQQANKVSQYTTKVPQESFQQPQPSYPTPSAPATDYNDYRLSSSSSTPVAFTPPAPPQSYKQNSTPKTPPRKPSFLAFGSVPQDKKPSSFQSTAYQGAGNSSGFQNVQDSRDSQLTPINSERSNFLMDKRKAVIPKEYVINGVVSFEAPASQNSQFTILLSQPLISQSGETILPKGASVSAVIQSIQGTKTVEAYLTSIKDPEDVPLGAAQIYSAGGKVLKASGGGFMNGVLGEVAAGFVSGFVDRALQTGSSSYSDGNGGYYSNTESASKDLGSLAMSGVRSGVAPLTNRFQAQAQANSANTEYRISKGKKLTIKFLAPVEVSL